MGNIAIITYTSIQNATQAYYYELLLLSISYYLLAVFMAMYGYVFVCKTE